MTSQPRARRKRKKPYTREERFHRRFKRLCDAILPDEVLFFHVPNAPRSAVAGGKLKAMGMRAGAPDLLFFHRGRAFGLELKAPKGPNGERQGEMSAVQKSFREDFLKAGAKYAIARSEDEALDILKSWEIPLKIKETTVGQAD